MNVIVQSKSMKVTQSIQTLVQKSLVKLLARGYRISQIKVFIENVARKKNDGKACMAKIEVRLPRQVLVVVGYAKTIYQAVLQASRSAIRAVRKAKERRLSFRKGAAGLSELWPTEEVSVT